MVSFKYGWLNRESDVLKKHYYNDKFPLSDEEILERMNIKTIENFLRNKKLKNLK